jgi:predicted tellurium resistance membrane protein TerC
MRANSPRHTLRARLPLQQRPEKATRPRSPRPLLASVQGAAMTLDQLTHPDVISSFFALTAMEIVLGIDNIVFISILTGHLPEAQARRARRTGIALALVSRLALLFGITLVMSLTTELFRVMDHAISGRDLILLGGGLFLVGKATHEIHHRLEVSHEHAQRRARSMSVTLLQIVILDVVFSLDSVITAVGMADHLPVMIAAVIIAIAVMMVAAEPVANFVNTHPTVKMLALSFLLLVGVALIADGMHFHIPRGYLYFAIAFSAGVEGLNLLAASARRKRRTAGK